MLGGSHAHELINNISTPRRMPSAECIQFMFSCSVLFCRHSFDFYSLSESIFPHSSYQSVFRLRQQCSHIFGGKCSKSEAVFFSSQDQEQGTDFRNLKLQSAERFQLRLFNRHRTVETVLFGADQWSVFAIVCKLKTSFVINRIYSEMDSSKWDDKFFNDRRWPHVESEFKKDFDTIERVFFIFFGILLAIVICVFILVIFTICYRLIKGDRNQLYRRPFYNGPSARPTHACNTI